MKPAFSYPIYPYSINRKWGFHDPQDYHQFGFDDHNGLDFGFKSPAKADRLIYAPVSGLIVRAGTPQNGKWQPKGGGIFLSILTEEADYPEFTNTTSDGRVFTFQAMKCKTLVDLLHCEQLLVKEGDYVFAGQLIAIGDSTGFSTGNHCHGQFRRVTKVPGTTYYINGESFSLDNRDANTANNSFDPTQFFTGQYARDIHPFLQDLQFGSTGDDVKKLQTILNVNPTGWFGPVTQDAVKKYQTQNGINPTGIIGPISRKALNLSH